MDCTSCGVGRTAREARPKAVERAGRLAVIRAVPVEVCDNCGDVYLDASVAKRLDDLLRRMLDRPGDQVFGHYDTSSTA